MAGGYSKEADKYSTYVRHANGSSEKIKILNSRIKVFDTSTIEVLSKAQVEPFSFTDYAIKIDKYIYRPNPSYCSDVDSEAIKTRKYYYF